MNPKVQMTAMAKSTPATIAVKTPNTKLSIPDNLTPKPMKNNYLSTQAQNYQKAMNGAMKNTKVFGMPQK